MEADGRRSCLGWCLISVCALKTSIMLFVSFVDLVLTDAELVALHASGYVLVYHVTLFFLSLAVPIGITGRCVCLFHHAET